MIPPSRLRRGMAAWHEVYRALDRGVREGLIESMTAVTSDLSLRDAGCDSALTFL
jgi:hypothetical protein